MRKNKMMRTASGLLVATLLTTSVISGTFAKYTTSASAQDSARVAKWGVTVTATGDDAFATEYDSHTTGVNAKTVVSANKDSEDGSNIKKVVAPGTQGTLLTYNIFGEPEVMVNIEVRADLELTGWEIDKDSDSKETYCPIVFKIKRGANGTEAEYKLGNTANTTNSPYTYTTVDALQTALENAITAMAKTNTTANTNLADSITVTWEWPFESGATDNRNSYQTDAKDTALGNLQTAPTIKMESSVTVEQVD